MKDKLLSAPLQPGRLRDCPACRKIFALKFVSKRDSEQQGEISTYRCKKCDQTFDFAACHPPDAV